MSVDPRQRFTSTVEDYRRYRPDYPPALFDWIASECGLGPGARVLDVGCGTGISARQLAARGWRVVGLDPNAAMLEAARAEPMDGLEYVLADAESPPDLGPFDAIVGGQSFHWLDLDRALPRFAELLGGSGRVVAFWNLREPDDALMRAYEALLLARCPEYAEVGAEPRAAEVRARVAALDLREAVFPHAQHLDREGLLGRAWSSSYVKNRVKDADAFDRELHALFDAHRVQDEAGERVAFVYRTSALSFAI